MRTIIFLLLAFQIHAQRDLDKNKVKTSIYTTNDKCWNMVNGNPAYEVPVGSGKHAMFANSLWIGGIDGSGLLHIAANCYKQSGATDFWSGPLDTASFGTFNSTLSAPYNTLWKVDCNDISDFINAYNNGAVAAHTYTISNDILNYPAKGAGNFQKNMEPFMDRNHDGLYNPANSGDYPLINGHQQILSIYNDAQNTHAETGGPVMGVEIHEHSFAYSDPSVHDSMLAINYTTFYRYTIYNRSPYSYHNVYVSDWSDVDLGYYLDDYIGSDSVNNFAYCYNSGTYDPTAYGRNGYGNYPPVMSHVILPTDCSADGIDNDHDGIIDEAQERFLADRTTYYNNNMGSVAPQTTNPATAVQYYNYMSGKWRDGSAFTYGGNSYGGSVSSNYVYTGDPQSNTGWTETTAGNSPGDRRLIISSGPFNFPAGSKIEWGYALVFSQDTLNQVNTISEFHSRVRRDVRNVMYYYLHQQGQQCPASIVAGLNEASGNKFSAMIYPNPAKDNLIVDLNQNITGAELQLFDLLGRKKLETTLVNGYRTELNLSSLEKGLYFLEIRSEKGSLTQKIIKD